MSDEQFNKLSNLLSIDEYGDEAITTLYAARDALWGSARDYAEQAVTMAESAVNDALDEALCALVWRKVEKTKKLQEKANDLIEQACAVTTLLCNAQKTGHDETDDALMYAGHEELGVDVIYAILEGSEARISAALDTMPNNTAPGTRCDPTFSECGHG